MNVPLAPFVETDGGVILSIETTADKKNEAKFIIERCAIESGVDIRLINEEFNASNSTYVMTFVLTQVTLDNAMEMFFSKLESYSQRLPNLVWTTKTPLKEQGLSPFLILVIFFSIYCLSTIIFRIRDSFREITYSFIAFCIFGMALTCFSIFAINLPLHDFFPIRIVFFLAINMGFSCMQWYVH
jgi:hypothetical protein